MSMQYVDIIQGTKEWLAWREKYLTASIMPALLGASPYETPYEAIQNLRGLRSRNVSEWLTMRGHLLEDPARAAVEAKTGMIIMPCCAVSSRVPYLAASFDGIDDDGAPHEIKSPHEKQWNDVKQNGRDSTAYKMYRWQVLEQMFVAESDIGFLHFFDGLELITFEIVRNLSAENIMLEAAEAAWDHKLNGTLPPPTADDVFVPEGLEAEQFRCYAKAFKHFKKKVTHTNRLLEKSMAKKRLLEDSLDSFGSEFASLESTDIRISRFPRKGSVDSSAVVGELSEKTGQDEAVIEAILDETRTAGSRRIRGSILGQPRSKKSEKVQPLAKPAQDLSPGVYCPSDKEAEELGILVSNYRSFLTEHNVIASQLEGFQKCLSYYTDVLDGYGREMAGVEGFGVRITRFHSKGPANFDEFALLISQRFGIEVDEVTSLIERHRSPASLQRRITVYKQCEGGDSDSCSAAA